MNAFESSDARSERFGVGKIRYLGRRLRAAIAAFMLSSMPLLTGGCATDSYAGVPLTAGAADAELQALAMRAQAGDKQAQLELGIRYEEGRGVPADPRRAARLYRLAASDSGGTVHVYTPPVSPQSQGRVLPVQTGARQPGLEAARERLANLERRRASGPGGPGDRGYREAERLFAAALDIRGNGRNYFQRIVGEPQRVSCVGPQRCTYERHFDISIGVKTRLVVFFGLNRSESGRGVVDCYEDQPGNPCQISAFVFDIGDEAPPHCVRVDPVRRAAARHGWRVRPEADPPRPNVTWYARLDDNRVNLFIRTLGNSECLRSIFITRSVAPGLQRD
jgi:hypothetical protein